MKLKETEQASLFSSCALSSSLLSFLYHYLPCYVPLRQRVEGRRKDSPTAVLPKPLRIGVVVIRLVLQTPISDFQPFCVRIFPTQQRLDVWTHGREVAVGWSSRAFSPAGSLGVFS